MTRVVITVEREGGSTIKIAEQSAMPLFTDDQTVMLVQEAFIRTCRALGVRDQGEPPAPQPDPGGITAAEPDPAAGQAVADAISRKKVA